MHHDHFEHIPLGKKTRCIFPSYRTDPNDNQVFNGELCYNFRQYDLPDTDVENIIFVLSLYEPGQSVDYTNWLQQSIKNAEVLYKNLKDVYIIYDTAPFHVNKIQSKCNVKSVYCPYLFLKSEFTDISNLSDWDERTNKALWCVGDVRNRVHKFPTLYGFYKNNKLDLLDYSLHRVDFETWDFNTTNFLVNILNSEYGLNLSVNELKLLYRKLERQFFQDKFLTKRIKDSLNAASWCLPSNYNNTCLEIVNESYFTNNIPRFNYTLYQWPLTEKIWKPILVGRPFVTISENDGIYKDLENMGFKTFLNYTNCPIQSDQTYTRYTLRNYYNNTFNRVQSFIENKHKFKTQIKQDIEHNKKQYKKLLREQTNMFYGNCPPLQPVPFSSLAVLFNNLLDFNGLFQVYNY